MKTFYHIAPIYKSFLWGGKKLVDYFRLPEELDMIGTVYHVIAVPGHLDNRVLETGQPLSEFYASHPEVFDCARPALPIRMTTTCNEGKQSYQLHPTDEYALAHDGEYGKVSGSVALVADDIVRRRAFGNICKTKQEFIDKVMAKDWDNLFDHVDQKNGEFLHTPAGVIHGGYGDGTITCTFSSNGDLTYRFYDYDRNDPKRPLELEKVFDCVNIPEVPLGIIAAAPVNIDGVNVTEYYSVPGEYTARRLHVSGSGTYQCPQFYFLTCVAGGGSISGTPIALGETLLIPAHWGSIHLEGSMELILISYQDREESHD